MEELARVSMDISKRVEDPARFLTDTGLMFEINRKILHPLGLALLVSVNEDGEYNLAGIVDRREDPEGIIFVKESYERGSKKYSKFLEENLDRFEARKKALGYIIQGE